MRIRNVSKYVASASSRCEEETAKKRELESKLKLDKSLHAN